MMKRRRRASHFQLPFRAPKRASVFITLLTGVLIGVGIGRYEGESWRSSPAVEARINACFTPDQDCAGLIVQAVNTAASSLHVMAYSFTSTEIAQALMNAKRRGVDVRVLIDRSQLHAPHSQLKALTNAGVPVLVDQVPGIAHNKILVIDGVSVVTGSFNWSTAAQARNAENVIWIKDPQTAEIYLQNWRRREAGASAPVKGVLKRGAF